MVRIQITSPSSTASAPRTVAAVRAAAGLAVLDVIAQEQLIERTQPIGHFMTSRLRGLQARFPCIGEVRRVGAMVTMELVKNRRADMPDADLTKALVQAAGKRGRILLSCGFYSNVIRGTGGVRLTDRRPTHTLATITLVARRCLFDPPLDLHRYRRRGRPASPWQ